MSFADDFNGCMRGAGLPAPGDLADSASEALELMHKLHLAWEAAGGEEEVTLAALATTGAAVGIDEAVVEALVVAGEVTFAAYLGACAGCVAVAAGSAIWDLLAQTDDSYVQQTVASAATDHDIPQPTATA